MADIYYDGTFGLYVVKASPRCTGPRAPLYEADAPGRDHSLTLTLTEAGTFGYLDVADAILGMRGNLLVRPSP